MSVPVILLAHGSPDPRAAVATHALAARVQERIGARVVAAFIDHSEPDVTGAAQQLAAEGETVALVIPAFLSRAFHVRVDVPRAVADAREASGIDLGISPPLGLEPEWRAAIEPQLPDGPLVLATAGTSSASAQKDLIDYAAAWSTQRGAEVLVAYASQAQPDVPTAIADLEQRTQGSVSVASLVLFDGLLPDRIREAAGKRPCSLPLDRSAGLEDVIVRRYRECGLAEPTQKGPTCHECSNSCNRREVEKN